MEFKFEKVTFCFVIVIALTINIGEALQCYECIAVGTGTDECNGDIVVKSDGKNVIECDLSSMRAFHSKLQENSVLSQISNVFAVDSPSQTYRPQTKTPMACVKLGLKVGSESVILRTCQTAQTETVKPCQVTRDKIKKDFHDTVRVDSCDICESDKCNGSDKIKSSTLFITFIPLFASVFMGIIYRAA
ncbi:hypothetical protein PV327_007913 [Microctonus hyperodae]|uniref:Protein quiver n=1 Tax=Microctonus hyperodae TaxID=165561 RepID=A0AA39G0Y3_MICHY|nr:hypothetical protein PV327_007913 [Microctonus hyperodae]